MLALIAGQGALPAAVVAALPERPLICAVAGFAPEGLQPDREIRLENLGTVLAELRAEGVTRACFAGAIRRPAIDPARLDAATLPLVPIIMQAVAAGDDAALRAVIGIFEDAGIAVVGAHEIAPQLLAEAGCPTRARPDAGAERDAARAAAIVAAMGRADVGQACAVRAGQALAVEGVFGTDWMLQSLRARPDGGGGLLFKAPKPGQDRRADLPVVGPATVPLARAAGLGGIVVEAGGVMVLDRDEVIARCDAAGLFFWGREPDG